MHLLMILVTCLYKHKAYIKMKDNALIKRIANAPCNAFANAFTVAGITLKFNVDGTVYTKLDEVLVNPFSQRVHGASHP